MYMKTVYYRTKVWDGIAHNILLRMPLVILKVLVFQSNIHCMIKIGVRQTSPAAYIPNGSNGIIYGVLLLEIISEKYSNWNV